MYTVVYAAFLRTCCFKIVQGTVHVKKTTNKYHSRVRDRIFAERIFQTNLNHYINM